MRTSRVCLLLMLALPLAAGAQSAAQWTPPAPPLVEAAPPPAPPPEPPPASAAPAPSLPMRNESGTPPPPGALNPDAYFPGQAGTAGYPYSPYGRPRTAEKPAPEVGLIVTESVFGMLSAAGIVLLPYFMLFSGVTGLTGFGDATLDTVLLCALFGAMPMAVAQTIVGLANGSRSYFAESWPAALSGVLAEAGLLATYFLVGGIPGAVSISERQAGMMNVLLVASIVAVPLIQVAVVNLAKQSKLGLAGLSGSSRDGWRVGLPTPSPILTPMVGGRLALSGFSLSLVALRF
jgi:hypothetical protein